MSLCLEKSGSLYIFDGRGVRCETTEMQVVTVNSARGSVTMSYPIYC